LTTKHLVEKGAVFNQIFAMKYESLCSCLSREYNDFEYADDENFEIRKIIIQPLFKKRVTDKDGLAHSVPFSSGLEWEMEYFDIFEKYAKRMTDAIYGKTEEVRETDRDEIKKGKKAAEKLVDEKVLKDEALQGFYKARSRSLRLFQNVSRRCAIAQIL
jgi:hypothetical protein